MKYDFTKLTKEKEYEIFETIRTGEQASEKLKEDPNNAMLIASVEKGKEARDQFFELNMPLCIRTVSKKYHVFLKNHPDMFDDLLSEAYIGLDRAINKFDHKKNIKFSTYATFWILSFVGRYVKANIHPFITAEKTLLAYIRMVKFVNQYKQEHNGECPPEDLLFEKTKASKTIFNSIKSMNIKIVELDKIVSDDNGNDSVESIIPDSTESVPDIVSKNISAETLYKVMHDVLTESERSVIEEKYGLLSESEHFEIDKSKERSLYKSAFRKLKKVLPARL